MEDKNMKNENKNDEAVSPVIATILMVAITVVLAGVLYVWASSLAEGNADGEFTTYVITADGNTAGDGPTTATDDSLVEMTMSTGQDINWAAVSVKISINDGAPLTCAKDSGENAQCVFVEFGTDTTDQLWSVGDGFVISESGQDLCNADATCNIEITITDTQVGTVIDTSSATAA